MERPIADMRPVGPFFDLPMSGSKSMHVRSHLDQSEAPSDEVLSDIVEGLESTDYDISEEDVFSETRDENGVVHVVTGENDIPVADVQEIRNVVATNVDSSVNEAFVNYH
ncbi:MAG: hypothetical protein J07AB43_02560 [Candidatus Nanosalina sp. J07AB43]|jgi:hypothetical protein|nr:MAG: hypothetical protein J07AB43_02560 [Candidatus Nanosalina sp. J07AB43]